LVRGDGVEQSVDAGALGSGQQAEVAAGADGFVGVVDLGGGGCGGGEVVDLTFEALGVVLFGQVTDLGCAVPGEQGGAHVGVDLVDDAVEGLGVGGGDLSAGQGVQATVELGQGARGGGLAAGDAQVFAVLLGPVGLEGPHAWGAPRAGLFLGHQQ